MNIWAANGEEPVLLQITFVSSKEHGHIISIFDPQDLFSEDSHFIEAVPGGDGVDENEALARPHVLVPHGGIFFCNQEY